jgi:hypothetical protein
MGILADKSAVRTINRRLRGAGVGCEKSWVLVLVVKNRGCWCWL